VADRLSILTDYLGGEFEAEEFVFPDWVREMMRPAALAGSKPVRDALVYVLSLEGEIAAMKIQIAAMEKEMQLRKAIEEDIGAALKMQSTIVRAMMRGGHLEGSKWDAREGA
jgi:hypothetical protein